MKYVWVTYDALLEQVLCVHDAPDCVCEVCKPIYNVREKENSMYQLEEHRFEIRKYDKDELEEI